MSEVESTEDEGLGSLRTLFLTKSDRVARALRYLGVPEADLDDAIQEVFLTAHRRRDQFVGGSVDAWLRAIALNVARTLHRGRRRRRKRFAADTAAEIQIPPSQERGLERQQAQEQLLRLLATLPEDQRVVVVLFEIEKLPMKQIAAELGCPVQTAYSRLRLGRTALRRAWEEQR